MNSSTAAVPVNSSISSSLSDQSSPDHHHLERQYSEEGTMSTWPFNSLTAYFRYLLGLSSETTKRSLSEEAESGVPESLSEWIRKGSDPNETDDYGYTPLVNACLRFLFQFISILTFIEKKILILYQIQIEDALKQYSS
jgi:hypothetical protein